MIAEGSSVRCVIVLIVTGIALQLNIVDDALLCSALNTNRIASGYENYSKWELAARAVNRRMSMPYPLTIVRLYSQ